MKRPPISLGCLCLLALCGIGFMASSQVTVPAVNSTWSPIATINGVSCTLGGTCTVTGAPSGTASGDLSGSFPGPTVAKVNGNTPGGTCPNQFASSIDSSGRPTCTTVSNAYIANSTIDLTAKVTGLLPAANIEANALIGSFGFTIDGVGTVVPTGQSGYARVPYACTISRWSILAAGTSPTTTIDIWKVATGTSLPTVSNTITASALPTLSTGNAVSSTTLTGWTTSVAANDIIGFNVNAVTNATWIQLLVECDRT